MNDDEIAQLNLFSGLALHALIIRYDENKNENPQDVTVRAVQIAEDLMIEIEAAKDRAED
tara:strand:- start:446 stop:625 length:180 start_codon:yes stop_codon:yes gene_type:complete